MKLHLHKWVTLRETYMWSMRKCSKCGKRDEHRKVLGGYQPKPNFNWNEVEK